jgi:oligosaccharyltransferase complex subunit beta
VSRGHVLSYRSASDSKLQLHKFGDYMYDNVVFFAPETEYFAKIDYNDFLEFIDQGGNVLVGASNNATDGLRDFAESCGVEFDPAGSEVVDHFAHAKEQDQTLQHTAVISSHAVENSVILPTYSAVDAEQKAVLYRGLGHAVDDSNVLVVKTLQGNPSTYSANPNESIRDFPENAGSDTLLVSAIQGRNNARTVISGSLDMFSNDYFNAEGSSNREFCADISAWAFGENGVLRFRDVTHHMSDGTPPDVILHEKERPDLPVSLYPDPEIARNSLVYRIKDELTYSLIVEEWKGNSWIPFSADDMQLEFVMLDAHVRKTMQSDPKTGKISTTFTAPDNYGIFKFRVLYRRDGYSILHTEEAVSLRPFKHDEYDRFLFTAYPYYTSAFSALTAFFVFSMFFLFSSDK